MKEQRPKLLNDTTISLVVVTGVLAFAAWRDIGRALLAAVGMALIIVVYQTDWAEDVWEEARPLRMQFVARLRAMWTKRNNDSQEIGIKLYDTFFGFVEVTGKALIHNLSSMGHIFIIGVSQYGKTQLMYNILYYLLQGHKDPAELQIALANYKVEAFSIFAALPHLRWPIAENEAQTAAMLAAAKKEMNERKKKFSRFAGKRMCTNLAEYEALTGERLPRLVIFIDETADLITPKSQAEKDLMSLAKAGLSRGITLIMATQRPTALGVSHEAQSQTDAMFCTYMKNSTEYGSVARIPKSVYSHMTPSPGRFMVYIPRLAPAFLRDYPECEGWGFVRTRLMPNKEIEALVRELSGNRPVKVWEQSDLEPVTAETKKKWVGDEEYKLGLIREIAEALGRIPTAVELRERIDMSRKTSEDWMKRYRERYE